MAHTHKQQQQEEEAQKSSSAGPSLTCSSINSIRKNCSKQNPRVMLLHNNRHTTLHMILFDNNYNWLSGRIWMSSCICANGDAAANETTCALRQFADYWGPGLGAQTPLYEEVPYPRTPANSIAAGPIRW